MYGNVDYLMGLLTLHSADCFTIGTRACRPVSWIEAGNRWDMLQAVIDPPLNRLEITRVLNREGHAHSSVTLRSIDTVVLRGRYESFFDMHELPCDVAILFPTREGVFVDRIVQDRDLIQVAFGTIDRSAARTIDPRDSAPPWLTWRNSLH